MNALKKIISVVCGTYVGIGALVVYVIGAFAGLLVTAWGIITVWKLLSFL